MSYRETVSCRVAIQMCIGHFPDGRPRHRTFSLRDVRPDATPEAIMKIVRALEPLLAHPITKVRKIVKTTRVLFSEEKPVTPAAPAGNQSVRETAAPVSDTAATAPAPVKPEIIPFRVPESQVAAFPAAPYISASGEFRRRKIEGAAYCKAI